MNALRGVLIVASLLIAATASAADGSSSAPNIQPQLALAVHLHTTMSSGNLSLEEMITRAKAAGLDGLILTENASLRVEYGFWPLRGLLAYGVDYPSVGKMGPAAYLDAVHAAQQRHPEMVLIPGVEVMPHYVWSGSLWSGDLTLRETQKNLLVLGLDQPAQLAALNGINGGLWRRWPARLWPLLMIVPAVWLWRYERVVEVRTKFFQLARRRRYRAHAAAIALIALLLVANNLSLAHQPADPYGPDPGDAPAQRLINHVRAAGGISIWSLPEAKDFHRYPMAEIGGLLRRQGGLLDPIGRGVSGLSGALTVETDPYPESLTRTAGYTAFGAIYEDTPHVQEPGKGWDQLLLAYLDGRRAEPVWAIGELAYHEESGGKRLSDIQTMVFSETRSPSAVLTALKSGAFYARQRTADWGLRLEEFSLRDAATVTTSGRTLITPRGGDVALRVAVSAGAGRVERVKVKIIRSGQLWQELTAETPFDRQWTDRAPEQGGRTYYRVEVGDGDEHLLTNPIFLTAAVR